MAWYDKVGEFVGELPVVGDALNDVLGEELGIPGFGAPPTPSFKEGFGAAASGPMYTPGAGSFRISDNYEQQRAGYNQAAEQYGSRRAPRVDYEELAGIDKTKQDQLRGTQLQLLGQLQGQARGASEGSRAAMIGQQIGEAGLKQAMAASAGNRGGMGLNQSQAALGTASQSAGQQAAAVRSQEQQQAIQAAAGLAGGARTQDIGLATSEAGLRQQANLATQQAALEQQRLNDRMVSYYTQMGYNITDAQAKANQAFEQMKAEQVMTQINAQAGMQQAEQAADTQRKSGLMGLGATLGAAAIFSDKRNKLNIADSGLELDKFMDSVRSQSFDYKPEMHTPGKHYGVMAQDLERTKVGDSFVVDTPKGKAVDYGKGFSALMAGIARLNERLNKLEDK